MTDVQTVVAPTSTRWATPAQFVNRLDLKNPSTALLSTIGDLIDEVSGEALRYVGRPAVARGTYVERLPGRGTNQLRVDCRPLESIISIYYRENLIDPTLYRIGDALRGTIVRTDFLLPNWYLTAEYGGQSERVPLGSRLRNDYVVTYVGGYLMPDDPVPDDGDPPGSYRFPAELRGKVIDAARANYFQRRLDPTLVRLPVAGSLDADGKNQGELQAVYRNRGEAVAFADDDQTFLRYYFR